MKDAVLAVFPVILDNEIDGNPSDLVFAGLDAVVFIGVDYVSNGSFFFECEAMSGCFLAKFLYRLSDKFKDGFLIP